MLSKQETKKRRTGESITSVPLLDSQYLATVRVALQEEISRTKPEHIFHILLMLEKIFYFETILSLNDGKNTENWRVDTSHERITFIVHPHFADAEKFICMYRDAYRQSEEQMVAIHMREHFGIKDDTDNGRQIIFLVEETEFFQLMNGNEYHGKQEPWWVRDFGLGVRIYYTKARENIKTTTMLTQNFIHEKTHQRQSQVLPQHIFNRLIKEWVLIEGMPNWWNKIFVRSSDNNEYA